MNRHDEKCRTYGKNVRIIFASLKTGRINALSGSRHWISLCNPNDQQNVDNFPITSVTPRSRWISLATPSYLPFETFHSKVSYAVKLLLPLIDDEPFFSRSQYNVDTKSPAFPLVAVFIRAFHNICVYELVYWYMYKFCF